MTSECSLKIRYRRGLADKLQPCPTAHKRRRCQRIQVIHVYGLYQIINVEEYQQCMDRKCKCNVTDTISWQGHHDRVVQLN